MRIDPRSEALSFTFGFRSHFGSSLFGQEVSSVQIRTHQSYSNLSSAWDASALSRRWVQVVTVMASEALEVLAGRREQDT